MSGLNVKGGWRVEDKKRESINKRDCAHEWKATDTKYMGSHLELVCVKCGKKKYIELFP